MRASEAAKILAGRGTMSLTWAFSLADKEDEEGIVDSVSGRLRLSPCLSHPRRTLTLRCDVYDCVTCSDVTCRNASKIGKRSPMYAQAPLHLPPTSICRVVALASSKWCFFMMKRLPLYRSFIFFQSIMDHNGGSVIAMAGKDCVAIASDLRLGAGAMTVAMNFEKVGPSLSLLLDFSEVHAYLRRSFLSQTGYT
jgi:hypothetical protein